MTKTPLIYSVSYFNLGACTFIWGAKSTKSSRGDGTGYISHFLYTWFAHVVWILEQVNKEVLGRHKAHGRFSLWCKNNTDETRTLVQRISYIGWPPYAVALNNWGKWRFVKSIRHLKRSNEKVRRRYNLVKRDTEYFSIRHQKSWHDG